jgi:hypothetical protein
LRERGLSVLGFGFESCESSGASDDEMRGEVILYGVGIEYAHSLFGGQARSGSALRKR